jgi:hypothetical protein
MADPADITPPYLDPSQYPAYADMQKRQMMAQILMGALQNQQSQPATPGPSGLAIVPKRGWAQNVAPLVTALMAGNAQKGAIQAQQNYFSGMMNPGGNQSPQQPQSPTSAALSQFPAAAPSGARATPGVLPQATPQPIGGGGAPPQPQQPPGGGNPMLLTGEPRTSQMLLGMMGQQEYAKALAGRYAPTDLEKQLRAANIDPNSPEGQYALRASISKATTNVQDVRPGGTLFDLNRNQPVFTGPQNGVQTQWGPNGPTQSAVPGGPEAAGAVAAAEAAGKAAGQAPYNIENVQTQGGGTTPMTQAQLIARLNGQTPGAQPGSAPSARAPGAPQTPAPGGFGQIPKLDIGQGLGAPNAFQEGVLKAAGQKHAELSSELGKDAALADQQLEYNREAANALPTAETGPMSEWLTRNRSALLEAGVPSTLIPGSGTVVPTMELNKALKNAALQGARQLYGARMTQTEVKLQTDEMSPSASMMSDAISSLMQQNNIRSMYAKQRAQDYTAYRQQGGDPMAFESWYASRFPLTKFARAANSASAQAIQAEMQRRGLAQ